MKSEALEIKSKDEMATQMKKMETIVAEVSESNNTFLKSVEDLAGLGKSLTNAIDKIQSMQTFLIETETLVREAQVKFNNLVEDTELIAGSTDFSF